jgi:hypothetical protein
MPALIFTSTVDPTLSIELASFYDLPNSPINFGSETRTKPTRYGGRNQASVQNLGDAYKPIEVSGKWDDRQSGNYGRAQQLATAFEAMRARSEIVRVEWLTWQRWGILHFDANHIRDDLVEWKIKVDVYWSQPPELIPISSLRTSPVDSASLLVDRVDALAALSFNSPLNTAQAFLLDMQTKILAVQGQIANVLTILDGITSTVELTADIARQAAQAAYLPLLGLQGIRARTKAATFDILSTAGGVKAVASRDWSDDIDRQSAQIQRSLAELIRLVIEAIKPTSTRTHIVREGESLMTIARLYYKDFTLWEKIADANDLESPVVEVGDSLIVPVEFDA